MPEQPPPSVSSGKNWEWQCRKSIISSISIKPLERIYKPGYSSYLSSHIVKGKASQRFIIQIFSAQKILDYCIFRIINKVRKNKGEMGYELETSKFLTLSLFYIASKNT